MAVAAAPPALRRYADRELTSEALPASARRLEASLTRLRRSGSEGVTVVAPLGNHVRAWDERRRSSAVRVLDLAAAFEAADQGTWAATPRAGDHRIAGRLLPSLQLVTRFGDPERVRRWAARLTSDERRALSLAAPDLVGELAGLPLPMRYRANAVRVERALADHRATVTTLEVHGLPEDLIRPFRDRIDTLAALAAPAAHPATGAPLPRQLLHFSGDRDGLAVEVHGDLATADHVAVFVPGITNTIDNFLEGTSANAARIQAQATRVAGDDTVATIAWLGYDTPGTWDAVLTGRADDAGPALHRFIDDLRLERHTTTTVVGHSYGSLVTGRALLDGLEVDHVVLAGSPGVGVDDATGLTTDADVYALRAPSDVVSLSEWHGQDPADHRFGATPLVTGVHADGSPVTGHSSYFDTGTDALRGIGLVVAGRGGEAEEVDRDWYQRAIGWLDERTEGTGGVAERALDGAVEGLDAFGDLARDLGTRMGGWLG